MTPSSKSTIAADRDELGEDIHELSVNQGGAQSSAIALNSLLRGGASSNVAGQRRHSTAPVLPRLPDSSTSSQGRAMNADSNALRSRTSPLNTSAELPAASTRQPRRSATTDSWRAGVASTEQPATSSSKPLRRRSHVSLAIPGTAGHVVDSLVSDHISRAGQDDLIEEEREGTAAQPGGNGHGPHRQGPSSPQKTTLGIKHAYRWPWCYALIMLWGLVLSLDRLTTYSYQTVAANAFGQHSDLAFITIVRSVVAALAGPPFAVLEQLLGTKYCWFIALVFYAVGHALTAASWEVVSFTAGMSLYELGANGLLVLQQSLLARITSSRDRAFFMMLPQVAFVAWAFTSAEIFSALQDDWRWGIGMFSILGTTVLLPLITLLHLTPTRPRSGDRPPEPVAGSWLTRRLTPLARGVYSLISKADMVGLVLLTTSTVGVLLPIVIAGQDGDTARWKDATLLAPLCISLFGLLPAFILWELRFATSPLLPRALLTSRTFVYGSLALILLVAGLNGLQLYLPTFLRVAQGSSARQQQNISSIFSFTYTLAALPIALAVRYARRYKPFIYVGALLMMAAAASMITKGGNSLTLFRIIAAFVVLGLGGAASMAIVPAIIQVDAQRRLLTSELPPPCSKSSDDGMDEGEFSSKGAKDACARQSASASGASAAQKDKVVSAIAAANVFSCLGSAVGSAMAGTIWSALMQSRLTDSLASAGYESQADDVYQEPLSWINSHAIGTTERTAVVEAYDGVWKVIVVSCTVCLALSVFAVAGMKPMILHDHIWSVDASDDDDSWRVDRPLGQGFFEAMERKARSLFASGRGKGP